MRSNLALARKRVTQNKELVAAGAGDRFALEQAETSVNQLESDLASAIANEGQVRAMMNATVGDDQAEVAQIRAQLENAKWELEQTTVIAPADGYAINVQLRPGSMTAAFPITPAMTFVEDEYQVIALFQQNELHAIEPGNEAEFTITTNPGLIVKATVDSIVWAQGQGQLTVSGVLPQTGRCTSAGGPLRGQAHGRSKAGRHVLPCRRDGAWRDLHQSPRRHTDPAQGDPAYRREGGLPDSEAALT